MVYGKEIAQTVFANNGTNELAGGFQITALAKPGKTLEENEKEINAEIERLKAEPPTAEEVSRGTQRDRIAIDLRPADGAWQGPPAEQLRRISRSG